jgi:drug/metabolite transporter (DMT)-like permease
MRSFSLDAMPQAAYKVLIVAATMVWGVSFVFMKDVVSVIQPAWLLGIRFTCAGLVLLLIMRKRVRANFSRRMLAMGALMGVFEFVAFYLQTCGLQYTTAGINAFLTAVYCVIVPFIWWLVARRRPSVFNLGAAVIALAGVWLVSVSASEGGLSIGLGEALTLASALGYACSMVACAKFSRGSDVMALTVVQFLVEGVLGLICGALTETAPTLDLFTPDIIGQFAFLVLLASVFSFGAQNLALAHVQPAQASLLLSLESVFGVVFSVLLTGEQITARLLVGFTLIFAAILISELFPLKRKQPAE